MQTAKYRVFGELRLEKKVMEMLVKISHIISHSAAAALCSIVSLDASQLSLTRKSFCVYALELLMSGKMFIT